jgi:hypothetical protein
MGGLYVGSIWRAGFYSLAGHKGQPVVWNAHNLHLYLVTLVISTSPVHWTLDIPVFFPQIFLFHLRIESTFMDMVPSERERETLGMCSISFFFFSGQPVLGCVLGIQLREGVRLPQYVSVCDCI